MIRFAIKPGRGRLLAGLMLACITAGASLPARAQAAQIVMVPGTVTVNPEMEKAVAAALREAADLFTNPRFFAITDIRDEKNWALISVIGLAQVGDDQRWSMEDGAWFGLVLLEQTAQGSWLGATQGTPEFSELITQIPEAVIDQQSKKNLDPRQPRPTVAGGFIFPLQSGLSMYYGDLGVHDNGFPSVVNGWKAVDLMSDGDTGAGHAPNLLLASAAGTVDYKCTDASNAAIHLGDFFYTHLTVAGSPPVGETFSQGEDIGHLKTGDFSGPCGWATQPQGWFHVHWGFPSADLQVEGWTLSMSSGNWTKCSDSVSPGSWFMPEAAPSGPAISGSAGVAGATLTYDDGGQQTIVAGAGGDYCLSVPAGWSGTVTPSFAGYSFEPASRSYTNLTGAQTGQDFATIIWARAYPPNKTEVCRTPKVGVLLTLSDLTRGVDGNLDLSSIKFELDGQDVTSLTSVQSTPVLPATRATIQYQPTTDLSLGAHPLAFTYPTVDGPVTIYWEIKVRSIACTNALLAPAMAEVVIGDQAGPAVTATGATSPQQAAEAQGPAAPQLAAIQDAYRRLILRR